MRCSRRRATNLTRERKKKLKWCLDQEFQWNRILGAWKGSKEGYSAVFYHQREIERANLVLYNSLQWSTTLGGISFRITGWETQNSAMHCTPWQMAWSRVSNSTNMPSTSMPKKPMSGKSVVFSQLLTSHIVLRHLHQLLRQLLQRRLLPHLLPVSP